MILSWSGGKDSALALYELYKTEDYDVIALLTTISEYDRVSIHGVRRVLLEQQAQSLGLALEKVFLPKNTSNEEYESKMRQVLEEYRAEGVYFVAFGDIFLEDLKKYRENNLSKVGMKAIFPIWGINTSELAHTFIDSGFKAVVTCVDSNLLEKTFVGRAFDEQFILELPSAVDPCGENGEFHSFVYDGPIFRNAVSHTIGEVVLREKRFYYCDMVPFVDAKATPALLHNG